MISLFTHAKENYMKWTFKKTKLMVFNTVKLMDFMPTMELEGHEIEMVEEMRILGLTIRSDRRWSSSTDHIVIKAFKKLWILRRLKMLGASRMDLLDVYMKQVRSILELAVPAWHSGITVRKSTKGSPPDILGMSYISYKSALKYFNLATLEARRVLLYRKFVKKAAIHTKHTNWFKKNTAQLLPEQEDFKEAHFAI